MLGLFVIKITLIFFTLLPVSLVGKFLDFHRKREGQEATKEAVGEIYLKVSYGLIFQAFCERMLRTLNGKKLIYVYVAVLLMFLVTGVGIELFLFGDLRPGGYLFSRYAKLALFLSPLGMIDYFGARELMRLAAAGRRWLPLILSLPFVYLSCVTAAALLSTFFLAGDFDIEFYSRFFLNRFYVIFLDPISAGMSIAAANGRYVNVVAFAYPVFAISSSLLIAAFSIVLLSSRAFHGLYDYLAARILTREEKAIHWKLALVLRGTLAIAGAILSFKWRT